MNSLVLLLGGNLGDKYAILDKAEELINKKVGTIICKSSNYETEPWGFDSTDIFLNRVVVVESQYNATDCLSICQEIELDLGRERKEERYSSRYIDIDILFFNSDIISEENLEVPHPRIQERLFVLAPLAEIIPSFEHPILKETISALMDKCADRCDVIKKV